MTVVARRFASVPARSTVDTWKAIVDLLAPDPESSARAELTGIAGVASALIASEVTGPLIVYGDGPRVRIYCIYGDDAIEGRDLNENPLAFVATDDDWRMSLPCPEEDLEWVRRRLRASARVTARNDADPLDECDASGAGRLSSDAATGVKVNLDEYLRG